MSEMNSNVIERSLEKDREALVQSLTQLKARFAPALLIAEGKAAVREQALPILSQVDNAIRARPLTAAIAGLALVALVLGRRQDHAEGISDPSVSALSGTRFEAHTRWEDEGGLPLPEPVDPDKEWLSDAISLRQRATRLLARIDHAARRGLAPAGQLAKDRVDVAAALARDTARVLGRGLESLTGAARENAMKTRERLLLNQLALGTKATATVREHPFASGIAIAAAGAAAALLFPQTETEDRLLGETRDRLLDDIRRSVRNEALQASAFARTLTDALQSDLAAVGAMSAPPQTQTQSGVRH